MENRRGHPRGASPSLTGVPGGANAEEEGGVILNVIPPGTFSLSDRSSHKVKGTLINFTFYGVRTVCWKFKLTEGIEIEYGTVRAGEDIKGNTQN